MGFSMFSAQSSPIAIDFGASSVKLLQISAGERPSILAAAELPIPDAIRADKQHQYKLLEQHLPRVLAKGKFKGRRAVCSLPAEQTLVQHMQIVTAEGISQDELVQTQLAAQLGWAAGNMVVRSTRVTDVQRDGNSQTEVICFAIPRDAVMRFVELLKKCKLELVGVHTEVMAMVGAFDHLHRREEDEGQTTMYLDLGWGSTKVAITHGNKITFARCIQVGGQHLDQRVAEKLQCDVASARAHRISEQVLAMAKATTGQPASASGHASANASGEASAQGRGKSGEEPGSATSVAVDQRTGQSPPELSSVGGDGDGDDGMLDRELTELADSIAEELSMSLRYHQSLFRGRSIDRIVFLGGEARNIGLCQHVARVLRLPAQLGDPLAGLVRRRSLRTPGLSLGQPQPGWAVPCGLCTAPTDL